MLAKLLYVFTDLGDSAVTGTFTLLAVAYFSFYRQRNAAAAMLLAFALSATLITLGKILLYSRCDATSLAFFDLKSPSGHSALSAAVYGVFASIVSSSVSPKWRILPLIAASVIVSLIVISRVSLSFHSIGDVIIGTGVGLAASAVAWNTFIKNRTVSCPWGKFLFLAALTVCCMHGLHFPAEKIIGWISSCFKSHGRNC